MRKGLLIFILSVLHVWALQAQPGFGNTRASASVVEPITITKSIDLNFESVAIIIAGSVEMVTSNTKGNTASIALPVVTGTFTAASFVMSNSTAYTYKVTVPQSPIEITNGKNSMTIQSFDSDPIVDPESGLYAGVFVSVSPMNVTVNYN